MDKTLSYRLIVFIEFDFYCFRVNTVAHKENYKQHKHFSSKHPILEAFFVKRTSKSCKTDLAIANGNFVKNAFLI